MLPIHPVSIFIFYLLIYTYYIIMSIFMQIILSLCYFFYFIVVKFPILTSLATFALIQPKPGPDRIFRFSSSPSCRPVYDIEEVPLGEQGSYTTLMKLLCLLAHGVEYWIRTNDLMGVNHTL